MKQKNKKIILISVIFISIIVIVLTLDYAKNNLFVVDNGYTRYIEDIGEVFVKETDESPSLKLTLAYILLIGFSCLILISSLLYLFKNKINTLKVINSKNKFVFVILFDIILTILLTIIIVLFANNLYLRVDVEYSSTNELHINMDNFSYDKRNHVYYQIGLVYVSKPVDVEYESMGIYIPGDYLDCNKKINGNYSCKLNTKNKIGIYTSENAPIVMQIETPVYSSQEAPKFYYYDAAAVYLKEGFIYVYSGCRGKDNDGYEGGAPWGVTDLKAAVRYLKYNDEFLPGNSESIFAFGVSASGGQATVLGASGDSKLYEPYLEEIGAIMKDDSGNYISDSIAGVMAWSPVTSFDYANESYEWNMGQYVNDGTRADNLWTSFLSDDMSMAFVEYVNELKIKDEEGNILTLESSSNGIYTEGSYYEYLLDVIEESLNNYLSDNYNNVKDMQNYINSLNKNGKWITFNISSETVNISSIEAFIVNCREVKKDVLAFDGLDRDVVENNVFGNYKSSLLHFDSVVAKLLEENKNKYSKYTGYNDKYRIEYNKDLLIVDKLGIDINTRVNMYNPMYYLDDYYKGYKKSTVAKYWRIRTGINQSDIALTVETNLNLALSNYNEVETIDFATVWNSGHIGCERKGTMEENFIEWIHECINVVDEEIIDVPLDEIDISKEN